MQDALAWHNVLLSEAIRAHGGHIFFSAGDGFGAAFAPAADALLAAADGQRALYRLPLAQVGPLPVRMALHTGSVEARTAEYPHPPLNKLSRLLAAAHGGQVLLSRATRELVWEALPEGASLRDLGDRRLRDFQHAE